MRPAATIAESAAQQPTAAQAIDSARFNIQIHPAREDWYAVEEWMTAEGWDPGWGDAQAVTSVDKGALFIGLLDGEPISAISLLRLSDAYAFLGNYIVRPGYRGRGFGLATWTAALPHAGARVVGLEAVAEELETYSRAGFTASHATIGYQGTIPRRPKSSDRSIRPIEPADRDAIVRLDAVCSPFARPAFLAAWLAANGTRALVHCDQHEITGFGVIRPSRTGQRIGPLVANTPAIALALYDALTADHQGERVYLNAPEPNMAAADLASQRALKQASRTVRMYSHPVRPTGLSRNYSIGSLAWG